MSKTIQLLVVEPGKRPYIKEIDGSLASLQQEVGGYIQAVYPFDDPVGVICNEDGKLLNLPLNRVLRTEGGEIYDIIAGTFLIVGLGTEDFVSLSDTLTEKYAEYFRLPETFVQINGHVCAIPQAPEVE